MFGSQKLERRWNSLSTYSNAWGNFFFTIKLMLHNVMDTEYFYLRLSIFNIGVVFLFKFPAYK